MVVPNPVNEIYLLWKFPAGLELVIAVCISSGQTLKFSFLALLYGYSNPWAVEAV